MYIRKTYDSLHIEYVPVKFRSPTKVASALVVSDRCHYFSIHLQPQHLTSFLTNVYCSIAIKQGFIISIWKKVDFLEIALTLRIRLESTDLAHRCNLNLYISP